MEKKRTVLIEKLTKLIPGQEREFLIFMGLFQQSFWATFFASTSMVLGAVYTLWTYNRVFFGNLRNLFLISYKDLDRKESYLFLLLIFVLFLMKFGEKWLKE